MANERQLVVKFVGDVSSLKTATSEADGLFGKISAAAKFATGAFAAGFVADKALDFLGDATKAAEEDEKAQKLLATTVKNTTGATDDQIESMEKWINQTQNATGVLDDQLRPAFQNLVVATGSVEQAQTLMGTALDISTAKGIDLETVTAAMAKAHDGNTGALQRLGIETKNAAGETESFDQIMQSANATFGGATQAAADTTAGKMAILKAKFEDIKENIGNALIPILADLATFMVDKVIPAGEQVVAWWEEHWPAIDKAIQTTLDVVVPIFKEIYNVIKTNINLVLAIVQPLIDILHGDWSKAWDDFRDRIKGVWEGIKGIISGQVDAIMGIVDGLIRGVKNAINAIIDAWNDFVGHLGIHVSVFGKNFDWDPGNSLKLGHIGGDGGSSGGGSSGTIINIGSVSVPDGPALVQMLQQVDRTYGGVPINVRTPS